VGGFGKERDRVRKVPAGGLYRREGSENHQRDEEPTLTGVMGVAMRAMGMRAVARVVVIAVMLERVRHELGNP
jgi:hypothetical protein